MKKILWLLTVVVFFFVSFSTVNAHQVKFKWDTPDMTKPANQKIQKYKLYNTTTGEKVEVATIMGRDTNEYMLETEDVDKQCYVIHSIAVYGEGDDAIEVSSDASNNPCDIIAPRPDAPTLSIMEVIIVWVKKYLFFWKA